MRLFIIPAAAAALVATAALAFAAGSTETGVISHIDMKAPSLTLKSGKIKTFWLGKSVSAADLKVGEKVLISYDVVNKKPTASAVTMAP